MTGSGCAIVVLGLIDWMMPNRKLIVLFFVVSAFVFAFFLFSIIGRDVLPKVNSGTFQVRLRGADGTRLERTETSTITALHVLEHIVGRKNIAITSTMVGLHPGSFSTNPIYLFMAGPQEAVMQVQLAEGYKTNLEDLEDRFRDSMKKAEPNLKLSFEPIELTDKILSQGSPTPIEVALTGKNKKQNVIYGFKIMKKLDSIKYLRDVHIGQSYKYPAININIDRVRAAELGVGVGDIFRAFTDRFNFFVAPLRRRTFIRRKNWLKLRWCR